MRRISKDIIKHYQMACSSGELHAICFLWAHFRKYSIPSRQIGNYVYVPKEEIDNLYKSEE